MYAKIIVFCLAKKFIERLPKKQMLQRKKGKKRIDFTEISLLAVCFFYLLGENTNFGLDKYKYPVLFLYCFFLLFVLFFKKKNLSFSSFKLWKPVKLIFLFCTFAFIVSSILMLSRNNRVNSGIVFYQQYDLFFLFFPILLSFLFVNQKKEINFSFVFEMLFLFQAFFFVFDNHQYLSFSNFLSISILNSASPFESSSALRFTYFCVFFSFQFISNKKTRFLLLYFSSLLLCCFCFKRFELVASIVLPVLFFLFRKKLLKPVKRKTGIFFVLLFLVLAILYYDSSLNSSFHDFFYSLTGIKYTKFVSGRDVIIQSFLGPDFESLGLGTSDWLMSISGREDMFLHCDLVKIYKELSIVGLLLFSYCYFEIGRINLFSFILIIDLFVIMLINHTITNFFPKLLLFLLLDFSLEEKAKIYCSCQKTTFSHSKNIETPIFLSSTGKLRN